MIVTSCIYNPHHSVNNSFLASTTRPRLYPSNEAKNNEILDNWIQSQAAPDEEIFFSNSIPNIRNAADSSRLVVLGPDCCPWSSIGEDISVPVVHYLPDSGLGYPIEEYERHGVIVCRTPGELLTALVHIIDELPV